MIDLFDLKLSDILPSSITGSGEVMAIAAALDKELQEITASIKEIIILPRIDELPEDVVDHLAGQLHVDYYEPLGLGLEKRRALVKSSLSWHRRKGTKSVLEEVIRILFLDDFKIEEWYEYGGEPYFFRLIINSGTLSREQYDGLIRAVYELKNDRSWLESIRIYVESTSTVYIGQTAKFTKKYYVGSADVPGQTIRPVHIYTGAVLKKTVKTAVFAKDLRQVFRPGTLFSGAVLSNVKCFTVSAEEIVQKFGPDNFYIGFAVNSIKRTTILAREVID